MMRLGQVVVMVFLAVAMLGAVKADATTDGFEALQASDYDTAMRLLRPMAVEGNAAAQAGLGSRIRGHGRFFMSFIGEVRLLFRFRGNSPHKSLKTRAKVLRYATVIMKPASKWHS
jgi:hypothetical protein